MERDKTFATRMGEVILTRKRDRCDKYRQSDIEEANILGEGNNEKVNRQVE